jgi:hypothetical protein
MTPGYYFPCNAAVHGWATQFSASVTMATARVPTVTARSAHVR